MIISAIGSKKREASDVRWPLYIVLLTDKYKKNGYLNEGCLNFTNIAGISCSMVPKT